jgi:hypothetical protein
MSREDLRLPLQPSEARTVDDPAVVPTYRQAPWICGAVIADLPLPVVLGI